MLNQSGHLALAIAKERLASTTAGEIGSKVNPTLLFNNVGQAPAGLCFSSWLLCSIHDRSDECTALTYNSFLPSDQVYRLPLATCRKLLITPQRQHRRSPDKAFLHVVLGYLAGSTTQHRRKMENENNYSIVEYTKRQIGNHAVKREKRKGGRWRPFADAGNANSQ
ncbi:hypothetical protein BDV97DRAFT_153777 [Delphinella strobiligena]|nr:hypothetical protein BDV97DRAFT_153777 [Delphinella strobiligena]